MIQHLGKLYIDAVGKQRMIFQFRTDAFEVDIFNIFYKDYQVRISH